MKHLSFALVLALCLASFAEWTPPSTELSPGVVIHPNPISASRWLWFEADAIASDTDCYYRCTLPVADNVASIEMTCYFDDTGEIYLNGARLVKDGSFEQRVFPMKAQNFKVTSEKLKPVNTLAIHVFNGRYYGGLFLLGKKHLKDGGVEYFHSAPFPEEGVDPGVHERD